MPKKLSIITINYNNYPGLLRTAQSVIEQTAREQFEWLVIDGGSSDESSDWLNENKAKIDVLVAEKDQGIYDAMNKGMALATGKYIWFMNSGDAIFDLQTAEKLLNDFDSDADVYFADTMFINPQGQELGLISKLKPQKFPKELGPNSFRFGMNICHQSFIVKRNLAPKYNMQYRLASDIDWIIQILKKKHLSHQCNFVLSRFETGGSSYQHTKKAWRERYQVLSNQYGIIPNFFSHIYIAIRRLLFKFS